MIVCMDVRRAVTNGVGVADSMFVRMSMLRMTATLLMGLLIARDSSVLVHGHRETLQHPQSMLQTCIIIDPDLCLLVQLRPCLPVSGLPRALLAPLLKAEEAAAVP